MSTTELELMHRARAARYAALEVAAAAADERIKALTEKLEEAEWTARIAQDQVAAVEYDPMFGKVWTAGMDAPEKGEALALLDLTTGQVYTRERWIGGDYGDVWIKADRDRAGQTRYEWPISDAGPFIAFRDGWGFEQVVKACAEQDTREGEFRKFLYGRDGYRAEGDSNRTRPELFDALKRVVTELESKHAQRISEIQSLNGRIGRMRYMCIECGHEAVETGWLEHDDDCADHRVVRYEPVSA